MISVSKKGNYGYFCCAHDSLEDLFYFVLHHAEKTPMVDSRCTFYHVGLMTYRQGFYTFSADLSTKVEVMGLL